MVDELTQSIMTDANFAGVRKIIMEENLGEYLNRAFQLHLVNDFDPGQKVKERFFDDFVRRNFELRKVAYAANLRQGTKTDAEIVQELRKDANGVWQEIKSELGQAFKPPKSQKPAKEQGVYKQKKSLPAEAAKLFDDLEAGRVNIADVSQERKDAAYQSLWDSRMREAVFVNRYLGGRVEQAARRIAKALKKEGLDTDPNFTPLMSREGVYETIKAGGRVNIPTSNPDVQSIVADVNNTLNVVERAVDEQVFSDYIAVISVRHNSLGQPVTTMDWLKNYSREGIIVTNPKTGDKTMRQVEGAVTFRGLSFEGIESNKVDSSPFKDIEHLTEDRLNLMGKVDPLDAFVVTVEKLASNYTTYKYFLGVKEYGMNKFLFADKTNKPDWASVQISAVGNERLKPLDGLWTHEDLANDIVGVSESTMAADNWYKTINDLNVIIQRNLTIFSPQTQSKNYLANYFFMVRNGWTDPLTPLMTMLDAPIEYMGLQAMSNFKLVKEPKQRKFLMKRAETFYKAIDAAFRANFGESKLPSKASPRYEELDALVADMRNAGLIGENITLGVIYENVKGEDIGRSIEKLLRQSTYRHGGAANKARSGYWKRAVSKAEKLYSTGDDIFKIFGALRERAMYADAMFDKPYHELSDVQKQEVDYVALENVKNMLPVYSRIGRFGRFMAVSPLMGNFIGFKMESLRVWYNTWAIAARERRHPNPKIQRIGRRRLANTLLVGGVKMGAGASIGAVAAGPAWAFVGNTFSSYAAQALKYSDDEEDKRQFIREYSLWFAQSDDLIVLDVGNGYVTTVSISNNDPFGDINRAINVFQSDMDENEKIGALAFDVAREFIGPILDKRIWVTLIQQVEQGTTSTGYEIYNQQDDFFTKVAKGAGYISRKVSPGVLNQFGRLGFYDKSIDWVDGLAPGTLGSKFLDKWRSSPYKSVWYLEAIGMGTGYRPMKVDIAREYNRRLNDYTSGWKNLGATTDIERIPDPRVESNKVFEEDIKDSVRRRLTYLQALRKSYYLPIKFDAISKEAMDDLTYKSLRGSKWDNYQMKKAIFETRQLSWIQVQQ